MVAMNQFASVDDDDDDPDLYDPKYPGRKVVKDGEGVRVPVQLTDGMPDWMALRRRQLFDARNHQPHFAVVDAADPAHRRAVAAYEAHKRWLSDAWRGPAAQLPPEPEPDDDDDGDEPLSARDRYIQNLQNAYRMPIGRADASEADAIQAATMRRVTPGGARPGAEAEAIEAARRGRGSGTSGVRFGPGSTGPGPRLPASASGLNRPQADAAALKDARADAERAHAEYCNRIANAWKA